MKLPLYSLKQIIFIVIVIGVGVLPLYGQQNSQAAIFKAAAQSKQDGPCFGPAQDNDVRAYVVLHRRSPVHPQSGVRVDLSKVARMEFTTTNAQADADPATSSRFALSAGETPAVPVKRLTPAVTADANRGTQTAIDPYVFPTREERAKRYAKSMFGPSELIRSAVTAGINQWKDSPEEWEQGMSGYGKRFASSFGRNMIQQTVIYGLDSALGLDTGFRRSGKDKFGERLKHALLENITSRTKSGKRVFSVPRVVGVYTAGVISREAWYPDRYDYKDGLRAGTNTLLMGFALNLVREFVVKF